MYICAYIHVCTYIYMTLLTEIQYGISVDHFGKYFNKDDF